jgi:UDP-glucose 4-epimerase
MKILVFGGAGYIGAHAVLELLDAGHSVVVFDNFSTGERLNVDQRAKVFEGDILLKNDLKKVFKNNEFDAVMHFSALKAPGESMINPELYSEVNINGTLNVLNQMLKSKVYKFIFSSSSSVYGEPIKDKIDERHPLDPLSFYGFTKLEIERILIWYSKITKLRFISLRYFNAAGYDIKSRIKIPERDAPNLIPKIMKVLCGEKEKLEIYGSDYKTKDGTCIRDYIHVTDIARAHINCLDYFKASDKCLFLNLATGTGHSVLEVIEEVKRQSGIKVPFKFANRRIGDPSVVISKSKYKISPINWRPLNSDLKSIISSVLFVYKL